MSTIPDDDKDTAIFPLKKFWFTLGFGHHHRPEKKRLSSCYTIIEAENENDARKTMHLRRGQKWACVYENAAKAGVDKYGLVYVPFDELQPQFGDNL